jgi:hypothetical protein
VSQVTVTPGKLLLHSRQPFDASTAHLMDKFPVNSGNIPPPPSHSTLVPLKHGPPPNLQINRTQNLPGTNGNRRKRKEANETPLVRRRDITRS